MDTLTQAALGAAVGGAVLGHRLGRKAVVIGAALGTLPDLDVFIDYGDAVANYTQHRGFTHSLFVLTGLGTLLALIATRFAPARDIGFRHWWAFFVLCLVTHPLLDALTTYGTQLLWPMDVRPSAWPVVFIIDPLYTLPLLAGLGVALVTGNGQRGPAWGLALSSAYLLFAIGAKTLVEYRLEPVLAKQGLQGTPHLVQPTPFNTLLWRVTIIEEAQHHEALMSVFDGNRTPVFETFERGAELEPTALTLERGERLAWFAGPFLRYEVRDLEGKATLVATDLRLGFPGFHPFSFTLADREDNDWHPAVPTELINSDARADLSTLGLLASRIFSPEPPLCTSDFVADRWVVDIPTSC